MTAERTFAKVQYGVWLRIADLKVHPTVQRRFDPAWAKKLFQTFDPDCLGQLKVVKDGKGYLVFDGQHRLWAAREYLGSDQTVPCEVHDHIPVSRQCELFLASNNAKAPKAIDKFLIHVRAEHETENKIVGVLARHKLKVDHGATDGSVRAVVALRTVFTRYGEPILDRSLWVLRTAWGGEPDAYSSQLLSGLGLLIHRFADVIEDKELSLKMSKASGPAKFIEGEGIGRRRITPPWFARCRKSCLISTTRVAGPRPFRLSRAADAAIPEVPRAPCPLPQPRPGRAGQWD